MNQNSKNPERLTPVPVPPGRRWLEFRTRVLPVLGFAAAIAAVFTIWSERIAAPGLRGRVEATHAEVISPQTGILSDLKVARFQKVIRGEPIAIITPMDPRLSLAVIQSEIDLLRARLSPELTQQRNATAYEQLRLAWLRERVDLAAARVSLARAENELKRDEQLYQSKVVSERVYDFSLKARDRLQAEVDEEAKAVAELDQGLQRLKTLGDPIAVPPGGDAMLAAILAQEERLKFAESRLKPITLLSPIDGMISVVYRQAGENVLNGDLIAAVSATKPDYIVGYLRQPFIIEPAVGMQVEIRMRFPKPAVHLAQIVQVGSQMEPITNSLAMPRPGLYLDMGLPIKISVPADLNARPGELVDLVLRPQN